jgi:predicted GNAT superfamily acetyltransferase
MREYQPSAMKHQPLEIRPLESVADFRACEDIQRQVWGPGDAEVVPLNMLVAATGNGGIAIGAFAEDTLIGFAFGFLATSGRYGPEAPAAVKLKHHSHMLAVLPEWRDAGVGYALKLAQREAARAQALRLMTWTYDPLESRNALLNIAKLGAVCSTYYADYYGGMQDDLNAGLPSDRFQVDWYIASNRVATRLSGRRARLERHHYTSSGAVLLNAATFEGDLPRPPEHAAGLFTDMALVEIPADFQSLKRADRTLALAWRMQTREVFQWAFERGYMVTDFIFEREPGRSFYVLTHVESGGETGADWSIYADGLASGDRETR